nr:hypothetical protein [uncultured Carboxylicivirga sp.]
METFDYPKSSNTLSIAGLALSVMAFVIALIPCFGMVAFIPALLSLVFALIGLAHNEKYRTPKSIAIVGIVLGTTALLIAGAWSGMLASLSKNADERIDKQVERIVDNIKKELQEADLHIRIEDQELSDQEIEQIQKGAEKAGEIAKEIASGVLKGIHSIDIQSKNKTITIKIPKGELNKDELKELEKELDELESEMQNLIKDFSITLEIKSNEERK